MYDKWHTNGTQMAHKWHTNGTQMAHKLLLVGERKRAVTKTALFLFLSTLFLYVLFEVVYYLS